MSKNIELPDDVKATIDSIFPGVFRIGEGISEFHDPEIYGLEPFEALIVEGRYNGFPYQAWVKLSELRDGAGNYNLEYIRSNGARAMLTIEAEMMKWKAQQEAHEHLPNVPVVESKQS